MKYSYLYTAVLLLCLLVLGACSSSVENPVPAGDTDHSEEQVEQPLQEVGINVNGQFNVMKLENVNRSGTTWVRGFLDFFQLYPDAQNIETDERIQQYLELKKEGYKNILSIKWNFSNKSFPAAGSDEMKNYKAYLNKLLEKVWSATDIIVVGNEPFIESQKTERGNKLVIFYQQMANHVRNFRSGSDRDIPIFIGAFNNLYLDGWRTEGANDLFRFARNNSWIAGVDLHIHHAYLGQINDFIDYANLRIRDNQKILVSEFSIKDYFRSKMEKNIPAGFASKYGLDPSTQNYQYLDSALKDNVPRREWVDFLSMSSWFENRKNYVLNAFQKFKGYEKFHIATYALRQSYPFNKDFTANTTPWILNGLFANRTVRADTATGRDQYNYSWIDNFRAIMEDTEN